MSQETTRLRDDAHASTIKAQESLDAGNAEQAIKYSQEAETSLKNAADLDEAEHKIKVLQADTRDLDATRIEATPSPAEMVIVKKEEERKGSKYDPNYRPQNYISHMPAAAQPQYVMDHVGENVKAEAQRYTDAFRIWSSKKSETDFRLNSPEWAIKQMTEGTDADGGYYVPEEFIARNVELYQGKPGGTLRDRTTNIRVTGKDGYAPSMAAVTWAAMTEATAPGAVKPTIGQVSYSLEKSGSLIQVSDELLADEAMNVPDLLAGACRKAAGQYQNVKLLNGTGAWAGVMTGGVGVSQYTFANAASITAADLTNLYYQIDADFRDSDNAVFISTSQIAAAIAAIAGTAAGIHALDSLTQGPSEWLLGKRYLQDDNTGNGLGTAVTTGQTNVLFGDWSWVYLFERTGFTVSRSDEVYWDAGLVGFKFTYRMGSATSNSSAFVIGVQA